MSFQIEEKIALVTGAASGIGLQIVKALLRNGLRGLAMADINKDSGNKVLEEIQTEFGTNKVIFVETDVSNAKSFEGAFKECVAHFGNLDILVNNAGILNDKEWEKMITINVNGVAHGTILGLDNYIPKYRTDKNGEGVIVNMASIGGLTTHDYIPMYAATKFAVVGMSISFGEASHYDRTKVKVLTMCPGSTNTPLSNGKSIQLLGKSYKEIMRNHSKSEFPTQEPEFVAECVLKIIKHAKSGSIWVAEGNNGPYQFIIPDRRTFSSNIL